MPVLRIDVLYGLLFLPTDSFTVTFPGIVPAVFPDTYGGHLSPLEYTTYQREEKNKATRMLYISLPKLRCLVYSGQGLRIKSIPMDYSPSSETPSLTTSRREARETLYSTEFTQHTHHHHESSDRLFLKVFFYEAVVQPVTYVSDFCRVCRTVVYPSRGTTRRNFQFSGTGVVAALQPVK